MASWTPVPLQGVGEDDDEDATTVLMSARAREAWAEFADADLTTPTAKVTRDDAELVGLDVDGSLDQNPRFEPGVAHADGLFSPWVLALVIGMSVPIALAAAAYLMV